MNTLFQQNNYEQDATIRKQSKQIEKLQLEINALKIRLLGASNDNSIVVESILHSTGRYKPLWKEESFLNRVG